jgi:hypothetical protein
MRDWRKKKEMLLKSSGTQRAFSLAESELSENRRKAS